VNFDAELLDQTEEASMKPQWTRRKVKDAFLPLSSSSSL